MHIALVVDEHGSLQGLVTLNDVLEAIVGALPSDQSAEPQVVPRDDGSWLIDGMMLADEFKHLFGIDRLPAEEKGYYQTLSGFVMVYLGRVPMTSDHFEWNGLRFEVVDMDGRRVDKLLVSPIKATTPSKQ
jgi:putative hemolysin